MEEKKGKFYGLKEKDVFYRALEASPRAIRSKHLLSLYFIHKIRILFENFNIFEIPFSFKTRYKINANPGHWSKMAKFFLD
jgi:hypothetical protein